MSAPAEPHNHPAPGRRKTAPRQESDTLGSMLRKGVVEHQLGLSINLMLFVGLAYAIFPSLRESMSAFFQLSYESSTNGGMFGLGPRDLYLVASFIVVFTALRAFSLDYALFPLARISGIASKKDRVRFAEQSYMMIYYAIYWTWGVVLFLRDTPDSVNDTRSLLVSLWTDFPKLHLDRGMKLYYLSQLAFWIQQIAVLHIEEMRKDHVQMLSHHIITVALIGGSYPYRQWRVGNAVLVCMDLVDFVFPLAKILRYLALQTACDIAFGLFVVLWLITRHAMYLSICFSIYAHVHAVTMPYGVYSLATGAKVADDGGDKVFANLFQPFLNPNATTVAFNSRIRHLFLGLLLALQCITLGWFVMICRVVMRVLRGEGAEDTRSDGEDEDEEDFEEEIEDLEAPTVGVETEKARYIEVESSSEDLSFVKRRDPIVSVSSSSSKRKGISSGLNLNGHKEILNRIGCLSEEQLAREREKMGKSTSPQPGRRRG